MPKNFYIQYSSLEKPSVGGHSLAVQKPVINLSEIFADKHLP